MAEIAPIDDSVRPPKPSGDRLSKVYAWGEASAGQLGLGEDVLEEGKVTSPTAVDELDGVYVTQIANGLEHTVVLTSTEQVYTFGSGEHGKLGHSDADIFGEGCNHKTQNVMHVICPTPRAVQSLAIDNRPAVEGNLSAVVCGHNFCGASTTQGHLYMWGENEMGQLCHQDRNNKKVPKKVSALREKKIPVQNLAGGANHTLMITLSAEYGKEGKEFGMSIPSGLPMASGQGQMGQLGLGMEDMRDKWVPELLDKKLRSNCEATIQKSTLFGGSPVRMVSAGIMHSLLLTASGDVYAFGFGVDGQLGLPKPPKDPSKPSFMQPRFLMPTPTQIEELSSVQSIYSGDQFNFAVTTHGEVYSWGMNDHGQLALGHTNTCEQPCKVDELPGKVQIACGSTHALALTADGTVMSWGKGSKGQLGHGDTGDLGTPKVIEALGDDIKGISAGGNSSFAWKNFGQPPAAKRKAPEPSEAPKGKKAKGGAKKPPAKKKKK
eukprot:TRINITY_DN11179_c0_g1_i5.p1 TRINITY_DN11179_c0_g1~~TRINITY_DN11179_c0_g1_i5.p1  ORF type:complete len:492 (-),score=121.78 TRINITY_DN11179_c0_g1_i5:301-1776(-)